MSRIGKKEIKIEGGVKVSLKDNILTCLGSKGSLDVLIPSGIKIDIDDGAIKVNPLEVKGTNNKSRIRLYERQNNASWGTIRQLISNSVIGVTNGFSKVLILEGVGFRASITGRKLILVVGYSHPIEYHLPEGIDAVVEGNTKIKITGCDKQLIGKVASEIRSFRLPEPYKGKGIRYEGEQIRRKAGKTGKK